MRQLCDSRAGAQRSSQEPTVIGDFFVKKGPAKTLRSSYDRRVTTVRCPYDARTGIVRCSYDVSSGYISTILNFLYNSELNKIVEATTTLRRPKNVQYRTISVLRTKMGI